MALLDNNEMFEDEDENFGENYKCSLTIHGIQVKVEESTVVIYNSDKEKSGPDFKQQADRIIEYLICEGYVNKKKFKVKIISSSM